MYFYDVNGSYSSNHQAPLIETFKIGNKTNIKDSTLVKNAKEIEKSIDNKTVVKGMEKMLSSVLNDVANENMAELTKLIALSNDLSIDGADVDGDINLTNINQDITVDSETSIKASQKIQNKITTSISKKLDDKMKNVVKQLNEKSIKVQEKKATGTNVGDVVKSLGSDIAKTASDVFGVSIGNSTNKETNKTQIDELKDKLKLDNSFTMKKNKEIADKIGNTISAKNMAKCAKNDKMANKLSFKNLKSRKGGLNLKDIKQNIAVKSVFSCAFDQSVLNDISTKIVNDLKTNIERMVDAADKYAKDKKTKSTSGDIYAAGVAGKAVLEGVGDAAVPIGKGISIAAEGVGKGVGSAMSGFMMPLIIGGVVLAIIGAIVAFIKLKSKGGDSGYDEE